MNSCTLVIVSVKMWLFNQNTSCFQVSSLYRWHFVAQCCNEMSVLTGFDKTRDIHGTQPMMFEQYFSLIKIFAVILSQAFPQCLQLSSICTYEREKLCVGIHICYQKKSFVNTQYKLIIKMLLFAFMQEVVACFTSTIIIWQITCKIANPEFINLLAFWTFVSFSEQYVHHSESN